MQKGAVSGAMPAISIRIWIITVAPQARRVYTAGAMPSLSKRLPTAIAVRAGENPYRPLPMASGLAPAIVAAAMPIAEPKRASTAERRESAAKAAMNINPVMAESARNTSERPLRMAVEKPTVPVAARLASILLAGLVPSIIMASHVMITKGRVSELLPTLESALSSVFFATGLNAAPKASKAHINGIEDAIGSAVRAQPTKTPLKPHAPSVALLWPYMAAPAAVAIVPPASEPHIIE